MDTVLLLIAAIIGGYGIVVALVAAVIFALAWVRVLRSCQEDDEAERRLLAAQINLARKGGRA